MNPVLEMEVKEALANPKTPFDYALAEYVEDIVSTAKGEVEDIEYAFDKVEAEVDVEREWASEWEGRCDKLSDQVKKLEEEIKELKENGDKS